MYLKYTLEDNYMLTTLIHDLDNKTTLKTCKKAVDLKFIVFFLIV